MKVPRRALASCAWLACALACACTQTTNLAGRARGGAASGDAAIDDRSDAMTTLPDARTDPIGDAATEDAAPPRSIDDAGVVRCGKTPCACSNAADDDGDSLSDARDPECIGPADDDERSFATGAERDGDGACQDCFFDGNSGSGNDGCRRATSCATTGDATGGSGSCRSCEAGDTCTARCRPLTPNGCDCFGCCEVHLPNADPINILLGPDCAMDTLADAAVCPRCQKASDCENPCDVCELCLGKGPDDLPAPCAGADANAPRHSCDDGEPVCDGSHPCPAEMYCQWGCCLPILF